MRLSQLFTRTLKDAPADEAAVNAQLLIRGGFVHKEMAGVYSILPLGFRVMENLIRVVREEMDAIGGIQMKTSVLQSREVWEKTGRWGDDVVDTWFKTELKSGGEVGLSFTNEEAYSAILRNFVSSYKDLPAYPYDFKTIFRNEARAKSGILRGREFYWKALYSFSRNEKEHLEFYERAREAYKNVFRRVGIGDRTYLTFASGGTFSKFSHEFQTVCGAGEDLIYIPKEDFGKGLGIQTGHAAINKEIFTDELKKDLGLDGDFVEQKAIEVGNIFTLGTKFSEPFGLTYKDRDGTDVPVFMGSYGIGITRLMGTIVEVSHDDTGIIWPKGVAPFAVHLVSIGQVERCDALYDKLKTAGIDVLYDDRDKTPGEKFADADLIGCPVRITIGGKTPESKVEFKLRSEKEFRLVDESELSTLLEA